MIYSQAINGLADNLPLVAAKALSCAEGGKLNPSDIMLEFDQRNLLGVNNKDIHIRVWAHDYPSRRKNLDAIRREISEEALKHIPAGASWDVWLLLAPTSYGSDTED